MAEDDVFISKVGQPRVFHGKKFFMIGEGILLGIFLRVFFANPQLPPPFRHASLVKFLASVYVDAAAPLDAYVQKNVYVHARIYHPNVVCRHDSRHKFSYAGLLRTLCACVRACVCLSNPFLLSLSLQLSGLCTNSTC